ncbi:MAG: hypothetical protein WC621_03375 [Patescibacteria group bacterium]
METISAAAQLIKIVLPIITLLAWGLAIHYTYWACQPQTKPQTKKTKRTLMLSAIAFTIIGILLLILSITIIFGPPPPGFYR